MIRSLSRLTSNPAVISNLNGKLLIASASCGYSFSSSSQEQKTLQSFKQILSDENKRRVQEKKKMVKPVRTSRQIPLNSDYKRAAVLVPLCLVNDEPSLLFTLRSSNLNNHAGQVSFPGGRMDETDSDFIDTALRETQEELGLDPSVFDIWGQLNPLPTSNGQTLVYPILGCTGEVDVSKMCLNDGEVEEVFTITLSHLCNHENIGSTRFRAKSSYTLPVYTGAVHRIWGLTAIMMHQVLTLIAPGFYTFKLRHKSQIDFSSSS